MIELSGLHACAVPVAKLTILDQDVEALLHQQGRIKDDQPETQG